MKTEIVLINLRQTYKSRLKSRSKALEFIGGRGRMNRTGLRNTDC
jgi:hypothetical protein